MKIGAQLQQTGLFQIISCPAKATSLEDYITPCIATGDDLSRQHFNSYFADSY